MKTVVTKGDKEALRQIIWDGKDRAGKNMPLAIEYGYKVVAEVQDFDNNLIDEIELVTRIL